MGLLTELTIKKLREEIRTKYPDIPEDEFNEVFLRIYKKIETEHKQRIIDGFNQHIFKRYAKKDLAGENNNGHSK